MSLRDNECLHKGKVILTADCPVCHPPQTPATRINPHQSHAQYERAEALQAELNVRDRQLTDAAREIAELRKQMETAKDTPRCSACRKDFPEDATLRERARTCEKHELCRALRELHELRTNFEHGLKKHMEAHKELAAKEAEIAQLKRDKAEMREVAMGGASELTRLAREEIGRLTADIEHWKGQAEANTRVAVDAQASEQRMAAEVTAARAELARIKGAARTETVAEIEKRQREWQPVAWNQGDVHRAIQRLRDDRAALLATIRALKAESEGGR